MGLSVGIVGLPNVGKSTIFNALTNASVASENYAFCTIEPNHGIVNVPDSRIEIINQYIETEKIVYNSIEFVDIAGLVKGASKGEGLGNKFLSHIRDVNAIIHVLRCFDNKDITHVDGEINPIRDIETINTELILKDIETVEKRINSISKLAKSGDKNAQKEYELMLLIVDELNDGNMIYSINLNTSQKTLIKSFSLLTSKPMIFVANISEEELANSNNSNNMKMLLQYCEEKKQSLIILSGAIEMEIASMPKNEQKEFLETYNLRESGLSKMISEAYRILALETFFTAGPKEIHAWPILKGSTAPQAAGVIHTDFQRGFIKAEIYNIKDLVELKSEYEIKNAGRLRQEGKDYIVHDGDIVFFKFNV
tara:strand:+ start:1753 stop:2853 length:1101 start_codon:yes stop_codon:yes gene_type:complete